MIMGTIKPQAKSPPLKFNAPSFGPMIYPTPMYAGLTPGELSIIPPLPWKIVPEISCLPQGINFSQRYWKNLNSPRSFNKAAKAHRPKTGIWNHLNRLVLLYGFRQLPGTQGRAVRHLPP